jgi:sugar/nucleoside kinase (ribokinase family)
MSSSSFTLVEDKKEMKLAPLRILVVGDAFVDIMCPLMAGSMEMPKFGQDIILAESPSMVSGGSALNTAIQIRSLFRKSYNAEIEINCAIAIGKDSMGELLQKIAMEKGVNIIQVNVPGKSTGVCVVFSSSQDRGFMVRIMYFFHLRIYSYSNI